MTNSRRPEETNAINEIYPKGWQEHSFVALCGTSEHAMFWMLEQDPSIRSVCLCLDHDEAGIEASGRLAEILHEHGYNDVGMLQSDYKDWNEDLKARRGLPAQSAEDHPQMVVAVEVCGRISQRVNTSKLDCWERDIPNLIDHYRDNLHWGRFDQAMDCMEQASALALSMCSRELRQLGEPHTTEELAEELCQRIQPHQNRGSLKTRHTELTAQFQSVLVKASAPGVRSRTDKCVLAESWMELAVALRIFLNCLQIITLIRHLPRRNSASAVNRQ